MALTNEILAARFNGVLRKLFQMQEGAPSPTLSPEIVPTLPIEVDRPEWAFLGGERLCFGGGARAATAAQASFGFLRNPANSGVLCVVERLFLSSAVATSWALEVSTPVTAVGDTAGTRLFRDGRAVSSSGLQLPSCQIALGATAGPTVVGPRIAVPTAQSLDINKLDIVLSPNTQLGWTEAGANSSQIVGLWWRERALDAAETR